MSGFIGGVLWYKVFYFIIRVCAGALKAFFRGCFQVLRVFMEGCLCQERAGICLVYSDF